MDYQESFCNVIPGLPYEAHIKLSCVMTRDDGQELVTVD